MNEGTHPTKGSARAPLILLLLFAVSFLLYATQLVRPYNLFAYAARAPISLTQIVERQSTPALHFLLTFLNLFIVYALAYFVCRKATTQRMALLVLVCGLILALLLGFGYPIGANDMVNYVAYGEALGFHGENPLAVPLAEIDGLAFGRYSGYQSEPSHYGPLWTWISAGLVRMMGRGSLANNLLAFKGLAVVAYGVQAVLIYAVLSRRKPRLAVAGLLVFAWNPLVLYEFAVNGHNDALMMALALLGIFFWDRGRPFLMAGALTLAALIKVPAVLLLPLFLVASARQQESRRHTWTTLLGGALLALALAGLAYLSLPQGWAAVLRLVSRSDLFTHSLPALVNLVLQFSGMDQATAQNLTKALALAALGAWYALQLARTWRAPADVLKNSYAVLLFLLLLATPWFQPWYVTWLVALAALYPHPAAPAQAALFSFTAVTSYLIYGFLWLWYARLGNWARTLGVTLVAVGTTYLVPWVYTAWLWWRRERPASPAS